jgi:hypothetical protein
VEDERTHGNIYTGTQCGQRHGPKKIKRDRPAECIREKTAKLIRDKSLCRIVGTYKLEHAASNVEINVATSVRI